MDTEDTKQGIYEIGDDLLTMYKGQYLDMCIVIPEHRPKGWFELCDEVFETVCSEHQGIEESSGTGFGGTDFQCRVPKGQYISAVNRLYELANEHDLKVEYPDPTTN